MNNASSHHDDAIRSRLNTLLEEHSQAEIARRTNTSRNNVNRYVRGGKIPADFCAALAENLGLSQAWLLNGFGSQQSTDVKGDVSGKAAELLDLVKAMQSVAKLRLGALTGKQEAKMLRQLQEALTQYDHIRQRLNAYAKESMRQQIDSIQELVNKGALGQAHEQCAVAAETIRFCEDTDINIEFNDLRGAIALQRGRIDHAIKFIRKAFLQRLHEREEMTSEDLLSASHYVLSLHINYRTREAQRVCTAVLSLADNLKGTDQYWRILMDQGMAHVSLGEIGVGTANVTTAYNNMGKEYRKLRRGMLMACSIFSGTLLSDEALKIISSPGKDIHAQARCAYVSNIIAHLPGVDEAPDLCQRACKLATKWSKVSSQGLLVDVWNLYLIKCFEAPSPGLAKDFLEDDRLAEFRASKGKTQEFRVRCAATQIARLCGNQAFAREQLRTADKILRALPKDRKPTVIAIARHYENALRLTPQNSSSEKTKRLRRSAERFFRRYFSRGYGCFAPMLEF